MIRAILLPAQALGRRCLSIATALAAIMGMGSAGCTRTIEVPRGEFETVRDSGAEYLVVKTVSGDTWTVYEGWATDSTLVVSLTRGPLVHDSHYPSAGPSQQIYIRHHPPMEIPFEDICWIDRVETDPVLSNAAAVSVGVVTMLFVLVLWSANQAGGSWGGY